MVRVCQGRGAFYCKNPPIYFGISEKNANGNKQCAVSRQIISKLCKLQKMLSKKVINVFGSDRSKTRKYKILNFLSGVLIWY